MLTLQAPQCLFTAVALALGVAAPSTAMQTLFVEGEVTATEASDSTAALKYRLLPPAVIEEGKRYPLILFLHGSGERGDDNLLQLKHFAGTMASPERRAKYPCFVLAPQCPEDGRWTTDDWGSKKSQPLPEPATGEMRGVVTALLEVARDHPVDVDRIYLTGLSMGGFGTFELATRHPDWFAAVAPVCGGGDETSVDRLAALPMSIWHGADDDAVPVERSQTMARELKKLGSTVEYHELKGVGHNSWDEAYGKGGCLDWMFAQRRDPDHRMKVNARLMAEALRPDERLAFLGDSITQQGAERYGYVDRLRTALLEVHPKAEVIPAGISGHKVPNLLAREERDVRSKEASLVFIYIGINDVWHSVNDAGTPREEFEAGLRTLAGTLEGPGGATLVMATPSVIGERPFGENSLDSMLEDYTALSLGVAAEGGRTTCDLQQAFRQHLRLFNLAGAEKGVLTGDGVHLNPAGNKFVAAEAALAIRRAALARK